MTNNNEWPTWKSGEIEISVSPPLVRLIGFGIYASESGADFSFEDFEADKRAQSAAAGRLGGKILRQILAAVGERRPGLWHNGGYSVEVRLSEVCIGVDDPRGGAGSTWPADDFLAGAYDAVVINAFGASVLREIRERLLQERRKRPEGT